MSAPGSIAIVQQAAEYLVWVEPDLSLRPVLATSWKADDGGRTWVFDIRPGVRFHDGRELTADDVVATFQRLVDPAAAGAGTAQLPFLEREGVSKLGDHRVRFALERPVGRFPYYTNTYNAVILPADYAGDFAERPVGTGPFRMTAFEPKRGARFARNEAYWDEGRPYLDAVEIALFEGQQAMTQALRDGRADVVLRASYPDVRPLIGDPRFEILGVPAAEHRQLAMRCDRKPFDDRRVRQAVALAIGRQELVLDLLGGEADVGNDHAVAPIYPEQVQLPQREADIAAARRLLAQAGHPNGFQAELYTAQYAELPQYAQLVRRMLGSIGIRLDLKVEPLDVYYGHWTEVTFGLTDWTSRPTPEQILSVAFRGGAGWNQARWANREFDEIVAGLEAEPDPARRAGLAQRAAEILREEVPAVIAYFNHNLRPMRSGVAGVPGSISQFLDLTSAHLT